MLTYFDDSVGGHVGKKHCTVNNVKVSTRSMIVVVIVVYLVDDVTIIRFYDL